LSVEAGLEFGVVLTLDGSVVAREPATVPSASRRRIRAVTRTAGFRRGPDFVRRGGAAGAARWGGVERGGAPPAGRCADRAGRKRCFEPESMGEAIVVFVEGGTSDHAPVRGVTVSQGSTGAIRLSENANRIG